MKQSLQTAIIMHIIYLCSIFEHSAVLFLRFFLNSVFKTKLKIKTNAMETNCTAVAQNG